MKLPHDESFSQTCRSGQRGNNRECQYLGYAHDGLSKY